MSQRITQKDLEHLTMQINKATGNPPERYTKDETGRHKANLGNYHLSYAYGGVALEQLCNPNGGVRRVSTDGYSTKRQMYTWMTAFLSGVEVTAEKGE